MRTPFQIVRGRKDLRAFNEHISPAEDILADVHSSLSLYRRGDGKWNLGHLSPDIWANEVEAPIRAKLEFARLQLYKANLARAMRDSSRKVKAQAASIYNGLVGFHSDLEQQLRDGRKANQQQHQLELKHDIPAPTAPASSIPEFNGQVKSTESKFKAV